MKIAREILETIAKVKIPLPPEGVHEVTAADFAYPGSGYYFDCEQLHEVTVFRFGSSIVTGPAEKRMLAWDKNGYSEMGMSRLYWSRAEAEKSFTRAQAGLARRRALEHLSYLCQDVDALEEMAQAALSHSEKQKPDLDGDRW